MRHATRHARWCSAAVGRRRWRCRAVRTRPYPSKRKPDQWSSLGTWRSEVSSQNPKSLRSAVCRVSVSTGG
eukprot:959343-Prymnesium_polylepis.2